MCIYIYILHETLFHVQALSLISVNAWTVKQNETTPALVLSVCIGTYPPNYLSLRMYIFGLRLGTIIFKHINKSMSWNLTSYQSRIWTNHWNLEKTSKSLKFDIWPTKIVQNKAKESIFISGSVTTAKSIEETSNESKYKIGFQENISNYQQLQQMRPWMDPLNGSRALNILVKLKGENIKTPMVGK